MRNRYRIYFVKGLGRWMLSINGHEFSTFKTHANALGYLIMHWDCDCLVIKSAAYNMWVGENM